MKTWFNRIILFLGWVSLISLLYGVFFRADAQHSGNVAHIKISGPILTDSPASFVSDPAITNSTQIRELFKKIEHNQNIKAILLEINSPGGTPVASSEIAEMIEHSTVPVVAWIRESGTSGAYWVASACDYIISHPMAITGSIGVIASHFGFEDLLPALKVNFRRKTAGKFKDIGSSYRSETEDEKEMIHQLLATLHQVFIDHVTKNRPALNELNDAQRDIVFSGLFFTGKDAHDLKLVDQLGGLKESMAYIENIIKEPVSLVSFKSTFFDLDSLLSKVTYYATHSLIQLTKFHTQFGYTPKIKV